MVKEFNVQGMTCSSCAVSLETYLQAVPGVVKSEVNFPNHSLRVEFDESQVDDELLIAKAKEIGYGIFDAASISKEEAEKIESDRLSDLKRRLIISAVFTLPVFTISMFFMGKIPYGDYIQLALCIPVMIWGGSEFYSNAWKRLKHGKANMDTLVALSTLTAFLFSLINTVAPHLIGKSGVMAHVYYESAVVIITLILLGRFLEERAKEKTSSAIKNLMGLAPTKAVVIRNGEEIEIEVVDIIPGDLIMIKPGGRIPVDGKVKRGESTIDESMITGEPLPVSKSKKDPVYAGTLNNNGSLQIIATGIGSETLLAQIVELVKTAQSSKANIQKLADKIAGIFVPIVLLLAIITFSIWMLIGPEPRIVYGMVTFVTVLIIACPCALGLATPTALMVGIGKGAQNGILIRDAQALQQAHATKVLFVDKTGTLTKGKPEVHFSFWTDQVKKQDKAALLAMESSANHPLANAISQFLRLDGVETVALDSFENVSGKGVLAEHNGDTYIVGHLDFLRETGISENDYLVQKGAELQNEGSTVIYFAKREMLALLAISDQIRDTSKTAIEQLHSLGIEVHMITGDNEGSARKVATALGIDSVTAGVLPADKANIVKSAQEKGLIVAMVGDGINDAAALAQADVGIAMGTGSDIALESAGVTLMHSDLEQVVRAFKLSKATLQTIKQNLFWAFFYNIIAIPVAAGVLYPAFDYLLDPMIAGGAMALSSLSVLSNSLRLKRKRI